MIRRLVFVLFLRYLIVRNYRERERGAAPDQWYWADRLAASWGHYVESP